MTFIHLKQWQWHLFRSLDIIFPLLTIFIQLVKFSLQQPNTWAPRFSGSEEEAEADEWNGLGDEERTVVALVEDWPMGDVLGFLFWLALSREWGNQPLHWYPSFPTKGLYFFCCFGMF